MAIIQVGDDVLGPAGGSRNEKKWMDLGAYSTRLRGEKQEGIQADAQGPDRSNQV